MQNRSTETERVAGGQDPSATDRVAEGEETFDHALHRLALEKQRKRDAQPGFYR